VPTTPPIARADIVGSLLRPPVLQEARHNLNEGKISDADMQTVEDKVVLDHIRLQEASGVDIISDGEARRTNWIASLSITDRSYRSPMGGFHMRTDVKAPAWFSYWRTNQGGTSRILLPGWTVLDQPLTFERDLVADEYSFLKQHTSRRTKYTFPSPSYHRIFWDEMASGHVYPDVDAFLIAIRDFIRTHVIERAIALGCDYIQMDAPNYGQSYTDPEVMEAMRKDGHDLEAELIGDAEIDNSVFEGITGITRAIHICRGNGPGGSWSATGGYDLFAPQAFPRLTNYDALLLEYDTPRAGDFSPLAHVLPSATVVLGLLTTKEPELEDAALIELRIREASKHVPLERLTLSTQCGFASAGAGNPLTVEQQSAKLRRVVEVAKKVWG